MSTPEQELTHDGRYNIVKATEESIDLRPGEKAFSLEGERVQSIQNSVTNPRELDSGIQTRLNELLNRKQNLSSGQS
ncbi:MAG TPA: hypothetical protein VMR41_01390 [Patescibacteria group bacterium]|nr:hypothetical protein [Patescibacteria group bacterium]